MPLTLNNLRANRRGANAVRKTTAPVVTRTNFYTGGAATFTATRTGDYDFYLYGKGGFGGSSAGTAASQGGGGGAAKKRIRLNIGVAANLVVADASHSTTTVSVESRTLVQATAGNPGDTGLVPGGQGGFGIGGDINRAGGTGYGDANLDGDPDTDDGIPTGTYGQGGAAATGSCAGFPDELPDLSTGLSKFPGAGGAGWAPIGGGPDPRSGGDGAIVVMGPY